MELREETSKGDTDTTALEKEDIECPDTNKGGLVDSVTVRLERLLNKYKSKFLFLH